MSGQRLFRLTHRKTGSESPLDNNRRAKVPLLAELTKPYAQLFEFAHLHPTHKKTVSDRHHSTSFSHSPTRAFLQGVLDFLQCL